MFGAIAGGIASALAGGAMSKLFGGGFLTRSEERFSRNAETDLVCRLLLEKKKVYSMLVLDRLLTAVQLCTSFTFWYILHYFTLLSFFSHDTAPTQIYTSFPTRRSSDLRDYLSPAT